MRKVVTRSISFNKDTLAYIDALAEEKEINRSKAIDLIVKERMEDMRLSQLHILKEKEIAINDSKNFIQFLLCKRDDDLSNDEQIVLGEIYDNLEIAGYTLSILIEKGVKENGEAKESEAGMGLDVIHASLFNR